jgi:hypothetical protein
MIASDEIVNALEGALFGEYGTANPAKENRRESTGPSRPPPPNELRVAAAFYRKTHSPLRISSN